jgi:hypothetical protein
VKLVLCTYLSIFVLVSFYFGFLYCWGRVGDEGRGSEVVVLEVSE